MDLSKYFLASLVAQMVKNLPAMQETWVQSLGREDPLEKEIATHSNILAWEIPWTGKPSRLYPMNHSLPGFSAHGISQARILEWVAISYSRGSS